MRITTKITLDMNTGAVLEHEFYEYQGTVALCKGDEVAEQSEQQQSAFDTQLMSMMQSQYGQQQQVYQYMKGILQPEINNPTGYSADQLTSMRTGATDANSDAFQNAQVALNNEENQKNGGSDLPSGTNSQLDAALLEQEAQTQAGSQESITSANANLEQQNYWAAMDALNGQEAQLNPLGYANAATSGSGAVANLSQAVTSSSGPTLGSIIGSVGGGVAAAFCPAEGSLYLMSDNSERPVETLIVGDMLKGVDDEPQTIEEIQSGLANIIRVVTENGCTTRNSLTHAFVLPKGGFVVAARSLGKAILTAHGPSRVVSVEPSGKAWVFNIITNGSHSYRADGVWALGVGEAERHVSMNEWAMIGDRMFKNHTKWGQAASA